LSGSLSVDFENGTGVGFGSAESVIGSLLTLLGWQAISAKIPNKTVKNKGKLNFFDIDENQNDVYLINKMLFDLSAKSQTKQK